MSEVIRNGVSTAFAPVNGALTGRPMRVTFLTPRPVTEDRSKGRLPKTDQNARSEAEYRTKATTSEDRSKL